MPRPSAVACRRRHFKTRLCRSLVHHARINAFEFGGGVTVKASGERQIDAPLDDSIPPEVLKPRRARGRVSRRVRDRDVAEPVLDRAGVNAVIGELVTAAM